MIAFTPPTTSTRTQQLPTSDPFRQPLNAAALHHSLAPDFSLRNAGIFPIKRTTVNKGWCPPKTPPTNTPPILRSHPEGDVPQYSIGLMYARNVVLFTGQANVQPSPDTLPLMKPPSLPAVQGQGTAFIQAIDSDRPGVKFFQSIVDTIDGENPLTILSNKRHNGREIIWRANFGSM
ncbi:hypothetical protein L198_05242 [Cryptococcus wingfieldii CBS 7118]|uniref:Uncharacterized protein n=1 Tax=Cryptococcus wingfieldii CBS 7118 TaxID=1295528 RepID=A0A1E3J099_9TREE|nr:hypothetical protein L198_05242 [Cryptococcus wingfieldii CBS 7118]ODN93381.1 hypothetical protein L198_05242 [Cryptococcus wingfieldii CBS 7118]